MLNPDGVANGYTRLYANGVKLNAHYKFADHKTPTIQALTKLIKTISKEGNLFAYFDLHSHITKRGIFFFGNPINPSNYNQALEIPYYFHIFQSDYNKNISSKNSLNNFRRVRSGQRRKHESKEVLQTDQKEPFVCVRDELLGQKSFKKSFEETKQFEAQQKSSRQFQVILHD